MAEQSWEEEKDVVASPNQPALYQDLGKESPPRFTSVPGQMQTVVCGTCLAAAVQCHVPWVRFTCTSVGRQRDLQGLPVFG